MKPEQKFKAGGCETAIWKNTKNVNGEEKDIYNVSFQRSYKDKHGVWKNTSYLNQNDLPKAMVVISKAFEYLTVKDGSINDEGEMPLIEEALA